MDKLPPLFNAGDVVKIKKSNQVGFIIEVYSSTYPWRYKVRFKDIIYDEPDVVLIERFNWDKYLKAEIDLNSLKEQGATK